MTERPMQNQGKRIKNQPNKIVSTPKQEAKVEKKDVLLGKEPKPEELKSADLKTEVKMENKVEETKAEAKEEKKTEKKEIIKKTEAVVNGRDLGISKKHSMAICDLIRGKNPEDMIKELELIIKFKKPLIMRGEIPHRKGNIMSGRYPINASKVFIKLLKSLSANASVNGVDNAIVAVAKADDASRPFKRGGSMRFKRTNVLLVAKSRIIKEKKTENKEKKA